MLNGDIVNKAWSENDEVYIGCTGYDFFVLGQKSRVSVTYVGTNNAEGFLGIRKL